MGEIIRCGNGVVFDETLFAEYIKEREKDETKSKIVTKHSLVGKQVRCTIDNEIGEIAGVYSGYISHLSMLIKTLDDIHKNCELMEQRSPTLIPIRSVSDYSDLLLFIVIKFKNNEVTVPIRSFTEKPKSKMVENLLNDFQEGFEIIE
jgi:hypothetical protein